MAYSVGFSQSLEILYYIELKSRRGEEKYLTIQEISNKLNIPVPSIKRLISLLKTTNFIESKKGVNGGLALAKSAENIKVIEVFYAVEGNSPLFKLHDDFNINKFKHKKESNFMMTKSKEILNEAEKEMNNVLGKYTLDDFFK
ncbi:RrF2 family transcriptional regulator [Staphylococcus simulans]